MQKLTGESHEDFKSYLRLEPAIFHEILSYTKIKKSKDNRSALPSGLNTTLRFLGTGDSHHSVAWNFHVAHNAISILAPQVCSAIVKYKDVFLLPSTLEAWQTSCNGLLDKMKLPLLLRGHRRKTCHTNRYPAPHITTTMFLIALLRLVHPNDKLLWVNVNTSGFVGDVAFPLRKYLIKLYPDRYHDEIIFNYRTSRGRRAVENAFGILNMCFQFSLSLMHAKSEITILITKACIILHQIMQLRYTNLQNAVGYIVPGSLKETTYDARNSNHQACSLWDHRGKATSHSTQVHVLLLQRPPLPPTHIPTNLCFSEPSVSRMRNKI